MLLNRIVNREDNSWKMAKLCRVLSSKFVQHRTIIARILLKNRENYNVGQLLLNDNNFTLKLCIIEVLVTTIPAKSLTSPKSLFSLLWPKGPSDLWLKMPKSVIANKFYLDYLNYIDNLTNRGYVSNSNLIS